MEAPFSEIICLRYVKYGSNFSILVKKAKMSLAVDIPFPLIEVVVACDCPSGTKSHSAMNTLVIRESPFAS